MRFFLDANILVYSRSSSEYRDPCLHVLAAITQGHADGCTSTAALEEVWHLELTARADGLHGLTADAYGMLAPLLPVTDEVFSRALSLPGGSLGSNDRVHAATCLTNGIHTIFSADGDFDSVENLRRVDPLDEHAVGELLARGSSPE
ncbi:MAG TPA: type II toxin-antitoxin system VapC family toxin [Solirubrobacteraceae bacterium]